MYISINFHTPRPFLSMRSHIFDEQKATAEKERVENQLAIDGLFERLIKKESCECTSKMSKFAEQCLAPELYSQWSSRQNLDQLGAKAKTVGEMGKKNKRVLARITLLILNTVIETAKAGAKDNEGLMDGVKELSEFASSPLAFLADDITTRDSQMVPALSKAYKSATRSGDKVLSVSVTCTNFNQSYTVLSNILCSL